MNSRGNTSKLYAEPGTKKKRKTYKNISGFHLSDEKFAVTKDLLWSEFKITFSNSPIIKFLYWERNLNMYSLGTYKYLK